MMKPRAFPLPKDVLTALSMLQEAGYEAFVVGGAVRDHLSGLPVHDYDLTTNAAPEEIMHVFQAFAMRTQGLRHGTVTIVFPNMPLEITTYRAESAYPDHRHPDHVTFSNDLIQDCARRDFTMNAICYHPRYGYIDPFNGIDDIRRKKIRTVGDPMLRFDEDALRILRALRFASIYGFTIVAETAQAMYKKRDTLCYIHAERIRDEWVRTMLGAHFPEILHSYRAIFTVFLPELKTIRNDPTLLNKLKTAILRQGDIDILMALLFSGMVQPNVPSVLSRLHFAAKDRQTICALYSLRHAPIATQADLLHILQQASPFLSEFILFYELLHADIHDLEKRLHLLLKEGAVYSLSSLAVDGNDLCDEHIPPVLRGQLLNDVLEEVIQGRLANKKADQLAFIRAKVPPDKRS